MNYIEDIITKEIFRIRAHPDERHVIAMPVDNAGVFTIPKSWIDGETAFRYLTPEENKLAEMLFL